MTQPTKWDHYAKARLAREARFIDALRQCIGLEPLYLKRPAAPWFAKFVGTGCTHTKRVCTGDMHQ